MNFGNVFNQKLNLAVDVDAFEVDSDFEMLKNMDPMQN